VGTIHSVIQWVPEQIAPPAATAPSISIW